MITLAPGQRLGPYEIRAVLGVGSIGEVYRARDTRLGRNVAIKVLNQAAVARGPVYLQRFELEARAAGSLNHPNLIGVHDIGTEGEVRYLVTEFLQGMTMRAVVDDRNLASLTGARPTRISQLSWAMGSSLAAVAGILLAPVLQLNVLVLTVDCEIVFAVDMNLNFEERLEIFDISVVRPEKLGDAVADSNAFLHPTYSYLDQL